MKTRRMRPLASGFVLGERVRFVASRTPGIEGEEGRVSRGRVDCPDRVWVALDCMPGLITPALPGEIERVASAIGPEKARAAA